MPKGPDINLRTAGIGIDVSQEGPPRDRSGKGPIVSTIRHIASPIAKSFSEALRIDTEDGSWIFVAGQVGVAIPPDNKPISFEQEVRVTFDRIRESLRKLDADMGKIVSIKVYLTDLAPYAEFSKVRGEVFRTIRPHRPQSRSPAFCLGHASRSTQSPLSPKGETQVSAIPSGADRHRDTGPPCRLRLCLRPSGVREHAIDDNDKSGSRGWRRNLPQG